MKKEKVYCENCWFDQSITNVRWTTCHGKPFSGGFGYYSKTHVRDNAEGKAMYMHELNRNNRCKYYTENRPQT